jgi:creatinine amidohydrolase
MKLKDVFLDELTMPEAEEAAKKGKIVILPVGSVEEHGRHLPLCTDCLQPENIAVEVARKAGCLVAPALRYGVCTETRHFPGTISVGFDSLYSMVCDILDELVRQGFRRLIVLSGHAGSLHMAALRLAARDVLDKYSEESKHRSLRIMVLSDYDFAYELRGKQFDERDGHGGEIETSRILAIRPDLVKGRTGKNFAELPRFEIVANPEDYWPNGIKGDPAKASVEKGKIANKYIISKMLTQIEEVMKK